MENKLCFNTLFTYSLFSLLTYPFQSISYNICTILLVSCPLYFLFCLLFSLSHLRFCWCLDFFDLCLQLNSFFAQPSLVYSTSLSFGVCISFGFVLTTLRSSYIFYFFHSYYSLIVYTYDGGMAV